MKEANFTGHFFCDKRKRTSSFWSFKGMKKDHEIYDGGIKENE
jgi:hypothetical protein